MIVPPPHVPALHNQSLGSLGGLAFQAHLIACGLLGRNRGIGFSPAGIPTNSRRGSGALHRALSPGDMFVLSLQVLPLEALVTDAGEVTEMGKTYVPPRVLQEALCVISGVPGLKGDIPSTEQLAQEMLIISHHPPLGRWLWRRWGGGEVAPGRRLQEAPLLQWQYSLDSGQHFLQG